MSMPAFCPFEEYFLSALTIRAPLRLHFFSLSRFFFSSTLVHVASAHLRVISNEEEIEIAR